MNYKLVAIKVEKRENDAGEVQKLLTDFGCSIKVRLGLHDVPSDACSPSGLIVLEVVADDKELEDFINSLNAVTSVTAKSIIL